MLPIQIIQSDVTGVGIKGELEYVLAFEWIIVVSEWCEFKRPAFKEGLSLYRSLCRQEFEQGHILVIHGNSHQSPLGSNQRWNARTVPEFPCGLPQAHCRHATAVRLVFARSL